MVFLTAELSVSWEQEQYMVSETDQPLMVCAIIVAGSLEREVSIAVDTINGTALVGMYGVIDLSLKHVR